MTESMLNKLKVATESQNEEEIIDTLKAILKKDDLVIELSDSAIIDRISQLDSTEVTRHCLEFIANCAKNDNNRNVLIKKDLIEYAYSNLKNDDKDVVVNAVRALNNLCYNNEKACEIVKNIGPDLILKLLSNDDNSDKTTVQVLSLLVNIFTGNDEFIKESLKKNLMSTLDELLRKYSMEFVENQNSKEDVVKLLLTVLGTISDFFDYQIVIFNENICKRIVDIFKVAENPEISVMCVDIFHTHCEKDEIKSLLAKEGVCEILVNLIEKHLHKVNDNDTRSILKISCDLIVLVLLEDTCMDMLYDNGKGQLYKSMVSWMDMNDDDLISTGVLALGNFARKDEHCIQMVHDGISKKLIDMLRKFNTSTEIKDVKVQHALLSTLKNLAIPKPNKRQILQEGLIGAIYPMIKIDQFFVIFKLLGTFRMIIDGQTSAALDLIDRVDFIERLVYWCYHSEHLGVRGEVPRLLSWLIKYCHSSKPFSNLIKVDGSVKCLVEMIASNHALMQNEAFLALNLLCVGCMQLDEENDNKNDDEQKKLMTLMVESDIGKILGVTLTRYGNKMDRNTVENMLQLLEQMTKFDIVTNHFKNDDLKESLEKLKENSNVSRVEDVVHRLEKITSLLSG